MIQIWQLVGLLRSYWSHVGQSIAVGVILVLFTLPGPYVTKLLIDNVYPNSDASLLQFVLLSSASLTVFSGLIGSVSSFFGQHVATRMSFEFQARFFCHIQSMEIGFFDKRETGELLSRFEDMQSSIAGTVSMASNCIMNLLHLMILPAVLFYIDWRRAVPAD